MLKPAKIFALKNMVIRHNKKLSPKMAQIADLVRVSVRLSSAHQYQLIKTYEMFCYKGHSSKKFITKDVHESAI
jgi:hypothetical protein